MPERNVTTGQHTRVMTVDEKGAGGAFHHYMVVDVPSVERQAPRLFADINFQSGPIGEGGVNGAQNEDLIAVVLDRLQCFQGGEFPCEENQEAIDHLSKALEALNRRTAKRIERGVEGKSEE